MVKAYSDGRLGLFTYGRNNAERANMV
ncbi:hypothetical protein [Clostridium sp. BL-8]|nr:hypothetical protein [Clostridium sp. BL-8]